MSITITATQLSKALAGAGSSTTRSKVQVRKDGTKVGTSLDELAALATKALKGRDYEAHAVAAFIGTMLQESAWLATTVEYGTGTKKYDPYRGRTFEQLTWKSNYQAFGQWCKDHGLVTDANVFVNKPETLGDLKWAWLGGIFYFDNRKLWSVGAKGDFQRVQTAVNLGTATSAKVPSGWDARIKAYRAFLSAYAKPAEIKVTKTADGPTKKRLQEYIGAEIDGDWFDQTWFLLGQWLKLGTAFDISKPAHVKALQTKVGLTGSDVDGDWWQPKAKRYGPTTTGALQTYLNNHR